MPIDIHAASCQGGSVPKSFLFPKKFIPTATPKEFHKEIEVDHALGFMVKGKGIIKLNPTRKYYRVQ